MESHRGLSAAVSVVPGVVFAPGWTERSVPSRPLTDGNSGNTTPRKKVNTVNGVPGKGGSIGSAGAVVVNGMVFVTSGYIGFLNGQPGNLLLAFGPPSL